jgi:acyl-CoA thioesterase-1
MFRWFSAFVLLVSSGLAEARTILVLGDSISAGYGLEKVDQGWVSLLQQKVRPQGIDVANASISGETTAGGLARIDGLLSRHRPDIVILELGGNDGLRGLSPKQMESNLAAMVQKSRAAGAKVLLLGMRIPPNYGTRFTEMFRKVFADIAEREGAVLVPFLLEGIGGNDDLMQADRVHPRLEAQPLLLERVWPKLEAML